MSLRTVLLLVGLSASLVALANRGRLQALAFGVDPAAPGAAGGPERLGRPIPELPAGTRTLDGAPIRLADLRGRVVLLHVWTFG